MYTGFHIDITYICICMHAYTLLGLFYSILNHVNSIVLLFIFLINTHTIVYNSGLLQNTFTLGSFSYLCYGAVVCPYTCKCRHECMHACMCAYRTNSSITLYLNFEGGLLSEPRDYRFGKVGYSGLPMCSEDPNVSTFPVPGFQLNVPVPDSLHVCWGYTIRFSSVEQRTLCWVSYLSIPHF